MAELRRGPGSVSYTHLDVYKRQAPTRTYNFDTNFLTPSLLPPLTPMLRAINTLTFTQDLLPTQ